MYLALYQMLICISPNKAKTIEEILKVQQFDNDLKLL